MGHVDRPSIAHRRDGTDEGFPIVLSSALGTTAEMWAPQVERLGTHHSVIRYDHRGHGGSSVPDGPYTLADLGQDVLHLMDSLSIKRADFAGLSLGGMVGMWIAQEFPHRIRRLALLCTYAEVASPEAWRERAALARESGTEAMVTSSIERWFTESFRETNPRATARFAKTLSQTSDEGYSGCCEAIATMTIHSRLGDIDRPTLVIGGAQDTGATPTMVRALADQIPRAKYHEVDAAHLASVEQPDTVGELLVDHFD